LKELDYFFRSFDGVPQAEISRSEVEAGVDIIFLLNEKQVFQIERRARRALTANSISVNKEK
jgi:tyrosyl-tRNA synthetase